MTSGIGGMGGGMGSYGIGVGMIGQGQGSSGAGGAGNTPSYEDPKFSSTGTKGIHKLAETLDSEGDFHTSFVLDKCNILLDSSDYAYKMSIVAPDIYRMVSRLVSYNEFIITREKVLGSFENEVNEIARFTIPENLEFEDQISTSNIGVITARLSKIPDFESGDDMGSITAFNLIDYRGSQLPEGNYLYRLQVSLIDKALMHLFDVREDLETFLAFLNNYLNFADNGGFDTESQSMTQAALLDLLRPYGFTTTSSGAQPLSGIGNSLNQSILVRGIDFLNDAAILIGLGSNSQQQILPFIMPSTATPETIQNAISHTQGMITYLTNYYNIPDSGTNYTQGSNPNSSNTTNIEIRKEMEIGSFVREDKVPISYEYVGTDLTTGFPSMTKSQMFNRGNQEVSKYFSGKVKTDFSNVSGLDSQLLSGLTDTESNKMLYLTPQSIDMSGVKYDTSTFDQYTTNEPVFQALEIARAVGSLDSDPNVMLSLTVDINFEEEEEEQNESSYMDPNLVASKVISAAEFLGNDCPIINVFHEVQKDPSLLIKDKNLSDKLASAVFAAQAPSLRMSVKDIDITDGENKLIPSLKNQTLRPEHIPIQLKAIALSVDSAAKNNVSQTGVDIFSAAGKTELAYQHFGNIKKVKYFAGFEKFSDGRNNLSAPIYKDLDDQNYNNLNDGSTFCVIENYSNEFLGMELENDFSTTNNFFVLRGKK